MNLNSLDPVYVIAILVSLSLAPFLAMMVTSYIKLSIVFGLTRNALGIQQIPPNLVINGLALILTLYIMCPVVEETFQIVQTSQTDIKDMDSVMATLDKAKMPLRRFLLKHTHVEERAFFCRAAKKLWPPEKASAVKDDDMMILVPAFTVSPTDGGPSRSGF